MKSHDDEVELVDPRVHAGQSIAMFWFSRCCVAAELICVPGRNWSSCRWSSKDRQCEMEDCDVRSDWRGVAGCNDEVRDVAMGSTGLVMSDDATI